MRFCGKVYKDGKFWLTEVPILDAMTQGHTRKEALAMIEDLLESLGARSRNAYARYEQGTSMPGLDKLTELYQAVAPGKEIVIYHRVIA